ncbi:molybdopterin-binding protein [Chloroflexi bacterium TSY]|nr:molybdopterin-binding protein [Chloroflexi bacterium TSY]
MKFHSVPIDQADGHILGHNVLSENGRRVLRKGKTLIADDIHLLQNHNILEIYIAELEAGDVEGNESAWQIAKAAAGQALSLSRASTGRVNIYANCAGQLSVDHQRLLDLNLVEGVALGTQIDRSVAQVDEKVATLKIIPFALPQSMVEAALEICFPEPILQFEPFRPTQAALILWGAASSLDSLVNSYGTTLPHRLMGLNSTLRFPQSIPRDQHNDISHVAKAIVHQVSTKPDLLLLAGDTAIMDADDVLPQAVRAIGGEVVCVGSAADPGNLFMLAYIDALPVVGLPSCARSPKLNVIDLILPRLVRGERLSKRDVAMLGYGGLLNSTGKRIW